MCRLSILSIFWKTCNFITKKVAESLEGKVKSRNFALAFQNYGTRRELRATRKEFFEKITYIESSTRSDSYTLLYIGYGNWVEETNRSIFKLEQEGFNKIQSVL